MGHKKWGHYAPIKGQPSLRPTCIDEHNALYDAWEVERDRADDLLKDRNAIQQKLDEARKRIAELEAPIRVPFSDAQIERMADAAHTRRMRDEERTTHWKDLPLFAKDAWRQGIRAALAAGGLEPCAVPEYDPADVALDREKLVSALIEAKRQRDELACKLIAKNPSEPVYGGWHLEDGYKIVPNVKPSSNTGQLPPDDQVEALARVLLSVFSNNTMSFERTHYTKEWMAVARAAIAHLSKRPEGLPTAEELDRIAEAAFDANDGTKFAATRAILDYLRPWLRNPAGCELDVTIDAAMKAYLNECMVNSGRMAECRGDGISGVLDLCRSRIRPVYECKECAKLRDEVTFWKRENVTSNNKMLSARAALEDE